MELNFESLKARSLFTVMALSLFAISFTMISDAQTAYGVEIFPVDNAVTETDFANISIVDVQVNENSVYLLYSDRGNLYFTSSFDKGDTWNGSVQLEFGGLLIENRPLQRIFINDAGDIGVVWEAALDPIELFFAVSTDNGLSFGDPVDFEPSEAGDFAPNGKDLAWGGDGDTVVVTFSDDNAQFQAVMTSTDFGETWNEPVVIQSVDDVVPTTDHNQGIILVDGMNMYVAWNADINPANVFFANSTDNGATWSDPIQVSDSLIGQVTPKMILNEDATKVLISWIGNGGETVQALSTDGGDSFDVPVILADNSDCDNEYDIDNLGEDVIFMCAGISDASRLVKQSSDFGLTYSSEFTVLSGSELDMASDLFPENMATDDILFSLWEDSGDDTKFLSFSEDKGQTFIFEPLLDLESATIENGILSRQAVSDDHWYWFIQTSSTTIDFVKVASDLTDHYLGYDAKVKHDDKKGKGHDDHKDKENGKGHEKYDDDDDYDNDHEKIPVTLVDDFEGTANYDVKKLEMLFNPVNKTLADSEEDVGGINLPESHLVAYDIKKSKGEPKFEGIKNIHVTNQFGTITVDIKKAKMLLVPSSKDHDTIPDKLDPIEINHFKCYDAKVSKHIPEFVKRTVDLKDQFIDDPIAMEVKKNRNVVLTS